MRNALSQIIDVIEASIKHLGEGIIVVTIIGVVWGFIMAFFEFFGFVDEVDNHIELIDILGLILAASLFSFSQRRSKKDFKWFWEGGYQESFYKGFKLDLGDPGRFETLGELVAAIYQTINYYNQSRIHSALNVPPRLFKEHHEVS